MPEATMTQEAPASTPGTPDGGSSVDQSRLINDAWSDKYFRSHEAELNPEAAEKRKQAQTPKVDTQKVVEKQVQTPKNLNAPKTPDKQEPQKSQFEKAFAGENGEIDLDRVLSFSLPEIAAASPGTDIGAPPAQQEGPKLEQWQQDQQEIEKMSKTLAGELLDPLDKAYSLISQGSDPVDALKAVYADRKAYIDARVSEAKSQKEFKRQQALEERLLGETKTKALAQQSATNINEVISSMPGASTVEKSALFNDILFGSDTGAKILDFYFQDRVEGIDKMNPQDRHAAALKFVNEITSNKAKLRFMFEQAHAAQVKKNLKAIVQSARLSAVSQHKSNALSAQKQPQGTQKRTAPSAAKGQWSNYFTSHFETADRV